MNFRQLFNMPNQAEQVDHLSRIKRPSPLGSTIFVGLRSLDVFIQYSIVAKGLADPLLNALSIPRAFPSSAPTVALGLPLQSLIIIGMSVGSAAKQIYWETLIAKEEMVPKMAILVSIFNTVNNGINSVLSLTPLASYLIPSFLSSTDNPTTLSPLFLLGTISYTIGILLELVSEVQRRNFKDDPQNTGKPYTGGLFGLARHINYGGYTIWRASYAFTAGGLIPGALVAALFCYDFSNRAVPLLDRYCSKRVRYDEVAIQLANCSTVWRLLGRFQEARPLQAFPWYPLKSMRCLRSGEAVLRLHFLICYISLARPMEASILQRKIAFIVFPSQMAKN